VREAVRSLLALILLGGFLEMLLPQDEMRRYSRLVVGLLVLLSLMRLVLTAGSEYSLESMTRGLDGEELYPPTSFLLQEGERVLQAGAEKAGEKITPVLEARANNLLQAATGDNKLKTELLVTERGKIVGAKIILTTDPNLPPETLERLAGEIIGISPETVEVEKVFVRRDEGKEE